MPAVAAEDLQAVTAAARDAGVGRAWGGAGGWQLDGAAAAEEEAEATPLAACPSSALF